uniref:Uncharacterized protein n=1 Tax=Anguilla anguilla TaxID=7936 RepID=A0A0E9WAF3_ANGAN
MFFPCKCSCWYMVIKLNKICLFSYSEPYIYNAFF